jgi:hypothetical protein
MEDSGPRPIVDTLIQLVMTFLDFTEAVCSLQSVTVFWDVLCSLVGDDHKMFLTCRSALQLSRLQINIDMQSVYQAYKMLHLKI